MLNLKSVLNVFGLLLCALAFVMLGPAAMDAIDGNPDWMPFALSAAFTAVIGLLLATATRAPPVAVSLRDAFLLTALCWIGLPAFAALPFLGLGIDFADAFFEAVSGITTTGSTVLVGLDHMPRGILFWRATLQWIGGIGIIAMAIVILPYLGIGGMQLFQAESSEKGEKILPRISQLASWIIGTYVGLTLANAAAYGMSEMNVFDAFSHAMTTVSTGGFANYDASFAQFREPATHWVAVLFMLVGALPFVVFIRALRGQPSAIFRDAQISPFVAFLVVTCVCLAIWLAWTEEIAAIDALRLASFNVISIVTTTGYASTDYQLWGPLAAGVFMILTFVGGCAGSTSGGIKVYRHLIMWSVFHRQLIRLFNPNRVLPVRFGARRVPPEVPSAVLAFITAYLLSVAVFGTVLASLGLDLVTAFSAAATAIGNVGPGLGGVIGPAGTFQPIHDAGKLVLAVAMIMGRLEIFTVIVLLSPEFWRR